MRSSAFSSKRDVSPSIGQCQFPNGKAPTILDAQITLDHLLRMSSGLQFDESASNPLSDVTVMLLGRPDAGLYAASKRLAAAPGTVWHYSSGTTNVISRAFAAVINDDGYDADSRVERCSTASA